LHTSKIFTLRNYLPKIRIVVCFWNLWACVY